MARRFFFTKENPSNRYDDRLLVEENSENRTVKSFKRVTQKVKMRRKDESNEG